MRHRGYTLALNKILIVAAMTCSTSHAQQPINDAGRSLRLAAEASLCRESHPQRSLLLGVEAMRASQAAGEASPTAQQAVIETLNTAGGVGLPNTSGAFVQAISADGRILVTAGHRIARVWDLAVDDPAASSLILDGHTGLIADVAISRDHRWVITAGNFDKTARLWDMSAADPSQNPVVLKSEAAVREVAINPSWVAIGSADGLIQLWKRNASGVEDDPVVLRGHGSDIGGRAITVLEFDFLKRKWLVSGSDDRTVRLWDLTKDDPSKDSIVLEGHESDIIDLAISINSESLVSASRKTVCVWDLTADKPDESKRTLRTQLDRAKFHRNSSEQQLGSNGWEWWSD